MKNLIITQFAHETNTFSKVLTDISAYKDKNYMFGDEIIPYFTNVKTEMGAFIDVFSAEKDIRLIPAVAFNASPGGAVTMNVYHTALNEIIKKIREASKVDGILLALHGAMVLTENEDGEGSLLEAIRLEVGPEIPIIVTLDLHANLTEKMMNNADGIFVYDHYPHVDLYETGLKAANTMKDLLNGKCNLSMKHKKLRMMLPLMPTELAEMKKFVKQMHEYEKIEDVINVSICHGFFPADICEQGVAVLTVTNNNSKLAQEISDKLANEIWEDRKLLSRKFYTVDEAIDESLASGNRPFVFADVEDNTGAGSPGDGTHLLRRLFNRGIKDIAFATIYDPETVLLAENAGVGSKVTISLGGNTYPEILGVPLVCEAYIRSITDGIFKIQDRMGQGSEVNYGTTVTLEIQGIEIIVTSKRVQPYDLEVFRSNGITPERKKILVVKSSVHYRASYGKIAYKIMDIEVPGLVPQSPKKLKYENVRRPIYPLDEI